jgi:hypothetical protein
LNAPLVGDQSRFLNRQLSLPVSGMSAVMRQAIQQRRRHLGVVWIEPYDAATRRREKAAGTAARE